MATVKVIDNILEGQWKTFEAKTGATIETLIRELDTSKYSDAFVECYDCETGLTSYEPMSDNEDTISVIVAVNGKEQALDYIVCEEDVVEIIFTPASDNWSWAGAFSGLASGAVTGALFGAKWGYYGALIGAIVGGVIGFIAGGIILGDALDNTSKSGSTGLDTSSLPDIRGSQNQPLTDNVFPVVFGRHLVTPFIVGSTYNDIYGDHGETIYIKALYLVGYGPLKITDMKLGDQFLAHNKKWAGNINLKNVYHGAIYGCDSSNEQDNGEIVNTWHDNDIEIEILQQGQNGEPIDYGTIYPKACIQEDIKANVLYIADGSTTEEPFVTYKNTLLSNGLRNNPIKFTRQNPLTAKVELNFTNGLYRTRTEDGSVKYGSISAIAAIQWRVYSDDNEVTSGDDHGEIENEMNPEAVDAGYWWSAEDGRAATTKRGWHSFEIANGNDGLFTLHRTVSNSSILIQHQRGTSGYDGLSYDNEVVSGTYDIHGTYAITATPANYARTVSINVTDSITFSCKTHDKKATQNKFQGLVVTTYTAIDAPYSNTLYFTRTLTGRLEAGETTITLVDNSTIPYSFEFRNYCEEHRFTPRAISNVSAVANFQCKNFKVMGASISDYQIYNKKVTLNVQQSVFIPEPTPISQDSTSTLWNMGVLASTYTDAMRQYDKDLHTGNTFPEEINNGWIGAQVFNFSSLSGTESAKKGLSEFRVVSEINFEEWARKNFTYSSEAEFIKMFREYFMPSVNSTQSIEVRVVRLSPNYLDETTSSGSKGPYTYNDLFTWKTLSTTMFDKEHFLKNCDDTTEITNRNVIIPRRPLSESDMRKHCVIAIRAKTDNTDQIGQTLKKFNCIAESFAPYYDTEQEKWFPENVTKITKYYKPNVTTESRIVPGEEITEEQFIEDRQNGIKSIKTKAGNDFVKNLVNNVIRIDANKDANGRYIIPDDLDETYAQTGMDPEKYLDNNVASVILYAGIGPQCGINALGYEDYDLNSLAKVYEFCEKVTDGSTYSTDGYHFDKKGIQTYHSKGETVEMFFTANAYIYQEDKLENVFKKLCFAARSVYTRTRNNRLTFIIDKPEKYHVALINQANTLSSSCALSYTDLPAGLLIPFSDEEDGYETNSIYCMKDGETKDNYRGVIEQYAIGYVTNPYQAWSLGRYLLANRIMNREVITKKIGMEGYSIGLGNIVCVQDDTMLIGTDNGGRITELIEDDTYIYGFIINNTYEVTGELDDEDLVKKGVVVMQPSQWQESRVLTLRLAPVGYVCEVPVKGKAFRVKKGVTNVVILANRIAKNEILSDGSDHYVFNPQVDNIVGFGEVGKESALYRVIKITSDEKHNYELTLLKYQEELYNYGDTLPSFQNNITIPNSSSDNVSISNNVTQSDLTKASGDIQSNLESYINAAVEDMQEIVDNLADNPTVYTSISSCGVAVNDNDIATMTQTIAITFFAKQGEDELEFYFPMNKIRSLLPQGYSVEIDTNNPHTLILTIAEGTLVTTENLKFFINFTAYKYNFNYSDGEETGYYDGADGEYGERTELQFETEYETGFTVIGVQGGRYLGAVTAVGSDYITIKSGDTTVQKAVTSLILGDYFVYQGNDATSTLSEEGHFYTSQIYQFLGVSAGRVYMWALDNSSEHIGGSLTDVLAVADEELASNNSDIVQFLDHLTANSIFVDKLVANTILTNQIFANTAVLNQIFANDIKATGSIRVGNRYNAAGTVADNTKTGAWLGNSGVLKAHKAELTDVSISGGAIQSDNYVSGTSGFKINGTTGNAEFNGGIFSNITASGGTFSDITATGGTFNDITADGGTFTDITADGGTFNNITVNNINAIGGTFTGMLQQGCSFYIATRVIIRSNSDKTEWTISASNELYETITRLNTGRFVIKIPEAHRSLGVPRVICHYASDKYEENTASPTLYDVANDTYRPGNSNPRYSIHCSSYDNVIRILPSGQAEYYIPIYFTDNNGDNYADPARALLTLIYI